MLKKITEFLNHERYQVIAITVCIGLLIWFIGCESKVRSLSDPSVRITRDELASEIDFYLANAEIRFKDLDRQDELKQTILDAALLYGQTGTINPMGLIATLAGVLGVGATVDNVRKRRDLRDVLTRYVDETKKNATV